MFTATDLANAAGDENAIRALFTSNIVMIQYGGPTRNAAQVYTMGTAAGWGSGWSGFGKDGAPMDIVSIKNFSNQVPGFNSYWCPYEGGDMRQVPLSNGASYMFTAKMDGCTFAIGSANGNGDRIVAHANVGGSGAAQFDLIKGNASFSGDPGMVYLGPAAYRFDGGSAAYTQATTFGIRLAGGQWKFYSQVCLFNMPAKRIELFDLMPLA